MTVAGESVVIRTRFGIGRETESYEANLEAATL